ncbi:MAG: zinc-binding dehydrogenase [Rhodospirillaceae bacterium]|nr:zinc-binding dehydrogenase [Rhodospirillaceae bacterium]
MKAAVIDEHGGPGSIRIDTGFPDPQAGPEDVVIKVGAATLNYHDIFTRNGMPGIKIDMPMICGLDVAGEIAELGSDVTEWSVGDRVLIDPRNRVEGGLVGETIHGGLAEFCRAPDHQLVRIPDDVSFAQAASLPVAYGTAHRMMMTLGKISAGEKCLILGASGGVGTGCVMLAKMAGAEVVVCASSEDKLERLKGYGADHGINYIDSAFEKEVWSLYGKPNRRNFEGGVDMVVNFTGGDTWAPSLKAMKRGARMMTCGATAGYDPKTDIRYIWTFELQVLGSNSWERSDLVQLMDYIQDGKMKPVVDRVFPLPEAREALRLLEDREVFGKVVIEP